MKFIYTIAFLIFFLSKSYHSFAVNNSPNTNFQITVFKDSSDTVCIESVKAILETNNRLFVPAYSMSDPFSPTATYWIYLQPANAGSNQEYVLTFHKRPSLIEVYPYPFSTISGYGGRMAPGRLKALSGCNVLLKPGVSGYLVKVQNRLWTKVSIKDIEIMSTHVFQKKKEKYDLLQGFIQGFFWLMLIYNLVLYFLAKKKLHLFYVIYIFFNSLFLFFTFGYSETYIFPDSYRLNLIFVTFQLIGMFFYLMFIRMALLSHCTTYTPSIDRRLLLPYAYLILFINLVFGSTVFYKMEIFTIVSDISNLLTCIVGITIFIYFYKSSDWFMRIIIAGSVILAIFGWVYVLYPLFNLDADNLFYEFGLLVELLLFAYALNKQHFEEQYKAELTKSQLERDLENKNRELVYQAIQLSAKDEAMSSIKEKIKEIGRSQKYGNIVFTESELNNSMDKNLWKEFEVHFNETHPGFYKVLMEKYPKLTQNEIRLCAFLKLNLNTKEIALITKKTIRSIDTMRSRIRKKMGIQRDTSLILILSQLQ